MIHPLFTGPELGPEALCAQTDPEAFFPDTGGNPEIAKRICRRCEVRDACLAWALNNEPFGVWGATTAAERQGIRMGRLIVAAESVPA